MAPLSVVLENSVGPRNAKAWAVAPGLAFVVGAARRSQTAYAVLTAIDNFPDAMARMLIQKVWRAERLDTYVARGFRYLATYFSHSADLLVRVPSP